jgi:hypothetical protein
MDAVALERLYRSSSNTVHFLDGDILRYQAKLWGRSQQPQNFNQSTSAGYYVDVCFVSVEERTTATRLSKSRMRKRAAVNTSTETDIAPFMNAKKTKKSLGWKDFETLKTKWEQSGREDCLNDLHSQAFNYNILKDVCVKLGLELNGSVGTLAKRIANKVCPLPLDFGSQN